MKKRIVIKLSGRVFSTDDTKPLKDFASFFVKTSGKYQPVIVAGGGTMARHYISKARILDADEVTLDEMGIEVSRLNARLLICALGDRAYPHPPLTLQETRRAVDDGLIVVTGGLHPGQSTNGTAALIAEKIGADRFINATDVDGVYDKDPNRHDNAKMFRQIDLKSLRRMLASQTTAAGGYDLMDIVALKIIERSKLRTTILRADIKTLAREIRSPGSTGTEIIGGRRAQPGTSRSRSQPPAP